MAASPQLTTAMEAAMAGAAEVGRVGRRIMQKIWDPEPVNNRIANEPVWCLGCSYKLDPATIIPDRLGVDDAGPAPASSVTSDHSITSYSDSAEEVAPNDTMRGPRSPSAREVESGWPRDFLDDFESRFWMTYRTDFGIISRSTDPRAASTLSLAMRLKTSLGEHVGFSSDTGWGCMIRSGQSLLANALAIIRLGREWRHSDNPSAGRPIISLFADDPQSPYSLHNFVRHGAVACGKYPGEWFGPSAAARCIQDLVTEHEPSFRVYSTGGLPDVYEDSFMAIATSNGGNFRPTLILVTTRLGIDKINRVYEDALIATLQMPQSVGIAGGRPSSSHYFVGAQGRRLFYLDPHHPRPALPYHANMAEYKEIDLDSCHTRRLRCLNVEDMDPSMLIGFLIRDEDDWHSWKSSVKHVQGKAIIHVSSNDPANSVGSLRPEAVDEVETLSDDDMDTSEVTRD